ncbi:MurR/RpiR family transcriptional regulator [Mollicutes bacterium LVI A0039]|nr:MurR/RpiR family transcriptional regulator [Mollicutes bacterium LVI A0039]
MNIYLQISDHQNIDELNLTATEHKIMDYVYHNINDIEAISVNAIADNCHCSTAAIHRFVKKFNCDGYKQFKTELISGMKVTKFANSRFQINVNELIDYIGKLDVHNFKDNLLKYQNKRVYIYGIGGSYVSAQYFVRQLNRFQIDATAFQPYERSGLKDLADAIVFISHGGSTRSLIDKALQVKKEGIPTFAVTKKNSKLAEIVDYALVHNESFSANNFNEKESQLATILLIEKIFYDFN